MLLNTQGVDTRVLPRAMNATWGTSVARGDGGAADEPDASRPRRNHHNADSLLAAITRAGERGLRHIGRDDLGDRRAERLVPLRKDHGDRQRLLPRRAAHAPDAGTAAGLFDHSDRLDDQVEDMRVAEEGGFAIDQRIDHPPRQRRIAAV